MSRVFVDSSVIVEALKGNEKAIEILRTLKNCALVINPIVFSEVVYIFIKHSGRSNLDKVLELLNSFVMLDLTGEVVRIAERYITNFKMLPNDALILATCKYYGIDSLASLDSDFEVCCKAEGIKLIA